MCLSTKILKFLDMVNYLAPSFSYENYLKTYGCELTKGHFPYEYMDDVFPSAEGSLLQPPKKRGYIRQGLCRMRDGMARYAYYNHA